MPVKTGRRSLETYAAAAAVAQDGGALVSLERFDGRCIPMMPLESFPALVTEAFDLLPVEAANVLPGLNRQCGVGLAIEAAIRRQTGSAPVHKDEIIAVLEGFADGGFDTLPSDQIDRIWLASTSELRAAMTLLRWTAVLYHGVAPQQLGVPGTHELSRIVAAHAARLAARAEAVLDSTAMRARIDRIAGALGRQDPATAEELNVLTADIPRTPGFSGLDWPWLAQRIEASRFDGSRQPDCAASSTLQ